MTDNALNIENVLSIIFKTTTKSAQFFADFYLRKDISVISRWRNNNVIPKTEDIAKIVEFSVKESTGVQQLVIRDQITKIINNSSLKEEIKDIIINKESFEGFLTETLSALTVSYDSIIMNADNIKSFSGEKKPNYSNNDPDQSNIQKKNIFADAENIEGDYTGIMKFDLVMLNKKNKMYKPSSDDKKNIDGTIHLNDRDMSRIKKYILSRISLGIIVTVIVSGIIIAQASSNFQNTSSKNVSDDNISTPTPELNQSSSFPAILDNNEISKDNTTATTTPEILPTPSNSPTDPTPTPTLAPTPQKTSLAKDNKPLHSSKTDIENATSNKDTTDTKTGKTDNSDNSKAPSVNINIEFEGDQNNIGAGKDIIIERE